MPKNLGVDTFPDPVRHFWAPWRPFWILQAVRRCGVAGSEQVPPSPLGWYYISRYIVILTFYNIGITIQIYEILYEREPSLKDPDNLI